MSAFDVQPCPVQSGSAELEYGLDHRAFGNAGASAKALRVRLNRNRHRRRADWVHGIRATHAGPEAAAIELPKFRDGDGVWRTAITLPEEIYTPIARAVLDELVERGLTARPVEDDRRLKGGVGLPPEKDSSE